MTAATTARKPVRATDKQKIVDKIADELSPRPIGTIVDSMFDLREQKRELETKIKLLDDKFNSEQELLMERLEAEKTDSAKGKKASVSITTGVVANVTDWSELERFVKRTGNFQLFQRRISDPAFRELMESKGKVPGIEPFTKKKVNLRTLG